MGDSYEEAISGSAYLKFRTAILAADIFTLAGRRAALEAATVGDCILPVRIILRGDKETALAQRDPGLGRL